MEILALWDKSLKELASLLRLDNRCKEQQFHINESIVKCLSNKEVVTERYQILLDYWLLSLLFTAWSRVLLQKITGSQAVKKFPAFYGTGRFITAFTNVRHLT
jgi:hypothetical protein